MQKRRMPTIDTIKIFCLPSLFLAGLFTVLSLAGIYTFSGSITLGSSTLTGISTLGSSTVAGLGTFSPVFLSTQFFEKGPSSDIESKGHGSH